jgi:hypothetical protein
MNICHKWSKTLKNQIKKKRRNKIFLKINFQNTINSSDWRYFVSLTNQHDKVNPTKLKLDRFETDLNQWKEDNEIFLSENEDWFQGFDNFFLNFPRFKIFK